MMQAASLSNAGMEKLQGMLKKASIIDTVCWIVIGIGIILYVWYFSLIRAAISIIFAITIVFGLASGITLYFATEKDSNVLYKIWFGEMVVLIISSIVGIIIACVYTGFTGAWVEIVFFVVVILVNGYFFVLVLRYYKWNNRAKGLGRVTAAISSALE